MSNRINGLIIAAIVAIALSACEGPANRNSNANNANLNANTAASPTPTAVANANTNTRTAPTREEYERDKERNDREAREQARGSGRTVGSGLNDAWLWTKTRFDLAAADDLRDSTVNVDVDNAVVTLTGTVASAAQKTKAEQVVKTVEGVKSVKNQLKVVSDNANANRNANANTRKANANK
ncbi:MAG TPA: BON domain-containing protein [Pyrinomonadaceae bacterium]|nr:BON domain-containing protein [Pyrinomonadaceae bacterium]